MLRRGLLFVLSFVAIAAWLVPIGPGVRRTAALPAANSDATYKQFGRVFPDPQGCTRGLPGSSPWAKGRVCAVQFLQWNETINGLKYLQQKYPRFAQLVNLHDLKKTVPEFAKLDMQSAGLPRLDQTRDRRDLMVFVVTDRDSSVPRNDRHKYAYSLSIHGIERAGLEGGVRAAEDLITWAATDPNKRILEPTNSGPTAGEALKQNVLYFVLSNPDGWQRGEVSKGGVYFQRYNGNGADVNREFPGDGFSNPVFTPFAEPEATGYAAYLLREKEAATAKKFTGSLDLHGMNGADSFSFTLLSGTAEDYETNALVVQQAEGIYADAVKRLSWSSLIADPAACPGKVPVFLLVSEGTLPMCPDQWGSVWDTIDYQTTGSFGDWMSSGIGLGAVGVDNEMAYSHIVPNSVFIPEIEQLHVDGNKGIIYSQLAALSAPKKPDPITVHAGYAPSIQRKTRVATAPVTPSALPAQAPITITETALIGGAEFEVKGPAQGVQNGGLTVQFTFTNVQGIALDSLTNVVLERYGSQHGEADAWYEVARWYRQEPTYVPAGARIDVNDPLPGKYRVQPGGRLGFTKVRVSFTPDKVMPKPNTPYDVANTDVFEGLGANIRPLTPAAIFKDPKVLDTVATYVLADDPAPGVSDGDRAKWFGLLKAFAERGGTLVLTDKALAALDPLGIVPAKAIVHGREYGGWVSFTDADNLPTMEKLPLTTGMDRPGAAESAGAGLELRRQTYDPGALGFKISEDSAPCLRGVCDAPQTIVDTAAWQKAGGIVAGRAAVLAPGNTTSEPIGVVLGEVPVGKGRIRISGGLLPSPTQVNPHPFGLEGFGLSWTGWQTLVNLLSAGQPAVLAPPTGVGGVRVIPRTGGDATLPLEIGGVVVALAALVRFARARRRIHALP